MYRFNNAYMLMSELSHSCTITVTNFVITQVMWLNGNVNKLLSFCHTVNASIYEGM